PLGGRAVAAQAGEVDLGQRLVDQALLVVSREGLAGHLLGRQHREVGDLLADALQGAARLRLDVAAGGGEQLLALLATVLRRLRLRRVGGLAGAGDDLIRLPSSATQAPAVTPRTP